MTKPIINFGASQVEAVARTLIGVVKASEREEKRRMEKATLSLEVSLTGGGTETWEITLERTASSH